MVSVPIGFGKNFGFKNRNSLTATACRREMLHQKWCLQQQQEWSLDDLGAA